MRNVLLALALVAALAPAAQAQAPAPTAPRTAPAAADSPLAQAVAELRGATDPAAYGALAARFEQLAPAAPADWLPRYYQAYALVLQARLSKADAAGKDQLLDRAEAALTQARQLKGDESELLALQAFTYQMRLSINPMQRYQEYGEQVQQTAELARTLNPANPRAYLILGTQTYYTPEAYGGGPAKARPLLEAAQARFATFKPATPLAPSWGQDYVVRLLQSGSPAASGR